jgi:hypothetical protein
MSRKLKKIMSVKNIGERDKKLSEYLSSLGGYIFRISPRMESITEDIVNKIIELEKANREEKLWIIALLSAIASIFSALAAWYAVTK